MASKSGLRALQSQLAASTTTTTNISTRSRASIAAARRHQQQQRAQSSSTSAIAYKALHRRISPLPAAPITTAVSPAAAVSSILYETPLPSATPATRHVLNCLVQNEPGVLSRVSGILAARGFNIDSLVVCSTEVQDLSRMTIVLQGQDGVVEQARRQLEDLVPVWAVLDYTAAPLVQRELLLAKISILGPEYFEELLAHHREMTDMEANHGASTEDMTPEQLAEAREGQGAEQQDYHPVNLAPSEALRLKHQHLETITYLAHQFGGKVLDISTNNCIVEVSAKPTRIDSFMKLISPFGILESARTGMPNVHVLPMYPCLAIRTGRLTFFLLRRSHGPATLAVTWRRSRREGGRRRCRHSIATAELSVRSPECRLMRHYLLQRFSWGLDCLTAADTRSACPVSRDSKEAASVSGNSKPCTLRMSYEERDLTQSSPSSPQTPPTLPPPPTAGSPPPGTPGSPDCRRPHR